MLILVTMCTEDYPVPHFNDGIRLIALNVNNDSQAREAAVGGPCKTSKLDENRVWD